MWLNGGFILHLVVRGSALPCDYRSVGKSCRWSVTLPSSRQVFQDFDVAKQGFSAFDSIH